MMPKPIKVLFVGEDAEDVRIVGEMLTEAGEGKFALVQEADMGQALERLRNDLFHVVLFDLSHRGARGVKSITQIELSAPRLAVVALSARIDEALSLQAIQAGAQDFLVKWQGDGFSLARSIRYAIEHKKEKERLAMLAQYDGLTGLANRVLFRDQLEKVLGESGRTEAPGAMMFLDLDRFKVINDTLGHDTGDNLLKIVAQRLRGCVRTGDLIARLGGDEFTVIQEHVVDRERVEAVARKIIGVMSQTFVLGGHELFIGASIGIALYPEHGADADTLLKNADTAMYHAKACGGGAYRFYLLEMGQAAVERLELESDLRRALPRGELRVYYQPQFDIRTREIVGAEALLRWQRNGVESPLLPKDFMPLAEETGLIVPIGQWVLRTACEHAAQWRAAGLPPLRLAVNFSARQLREPDVVDTITSTQREVGLEPGILELELNESLAMAHGTASNSILNRIHDAGIAIAIDNFGSGSSSLSSLRHLPISALKIDRSFINDIGNDANSETLAAAIITLTRSLKRAVIAEGIENQQQLDYLITQGCPVGQGNFLSPPLPSDEFISLARRRQRLRVIN
jgi:diguanylate cyclase (GGDEF)-like protein